MERNLILIHAGLSVIFLLYLLVRLFFSLFGLNNKEYQQAMRSKFKIPDWIFFGLIVSTGLYPIVVLAEIELYHLLKFILLLSVAWMSRYAHQLNFALASFLSMGVLIYAGYASFTDKPTFPRAQGTFEKDYPEISALNELEKGERIFSTICAKCHGNDGKKGLFGASDLTISEYDIDQKVDLITNGSPLTVMRSFKKELSPGEIQAVAKYVHQLANP